MTAIERIIQDLEVELKFFTAHNKADGGKVATLYRIIKRGGAQQYAFTSNIDVMLIKETL